MTQNSVKCPVCASIVMTTHITRSLYRRDCTACSWGKVYDALYDVDRDDPIKDVDVKDS